jgi:hypothetical protein
MFYCIRRAYLLEAFLKQFKGYGCMKTPRF